MGRPSNNDPWTEKLEEVSLPEADEAWKAMAAILDKEMPVDRKRRRRWLLLIPLLSLIGGSGYFVWLGPNRIPTASVSGVRRSSPPRQTKLGGASPGLSTTGTLSRDPSVATNSIHSNSDHPNSDHYGRLGSSRAGATSLAPSRAAEPSSPEGTREKEVAQHRGLKRSDPGSIMPLGISGANPIGKGMALSPAKNTLRKATGHSNDPLKCPPVERSKTTGFVVGIGLNQAIPVNGQQVWANPSEGLNRWWKDYIPVPFVRYYFQPKVFVQVEARIHAPQYTPRDFWFSYLYNDSTFAGNLFIAKLFYFQLPVSIHYAPAPNWSVGLGLQYSHYGKGIVALADSNRTNTSVDGPLSDFPMVFVQRNEIRGLVSLDYAYRHWIIGASYDEAFTRAMSIRVPNPAATPEAAVTLAPPPARNSSSQVYLRYILWDGRKKK